MKKQYRPSRIGALTTPCCGIQLDCEQPWMLLILGVGVHSFSEFVHTIPLTIFFASRHEVADMMELMNCPKPHEGIVLSTRQSLLMVIQ
jgi:hypothetical protein